jgi:hypothetical protein
MPVFWPELVNIAVAGAGCLSVQIYRYARFSGSFNLFLTLHAETRY